MNTKELLGKKIIDKNARDLSKLAEITFNVKTFKISKIYGSIGNPLSKKYYDIPVGAILAVGDYIQVNDTLEELEEKMLDKIPESEENTVRINNLLGKTILNTEGNVSGKVSTIDVNLETYEINYLEISESNSAFGKNKASIQVKQEDIASIGDYILVKKDFVQNDEESEEENEDSVKVDIE